MEYKRFGKAAVIATAVAAIVLIIAVAAFLFWRDYHPSYPKLPYPQSVPSAALDVDSPAEDTLSMAISSSTTTTLPSSFDWKKALNDIDWQQAVREGCRSDFDYVCGSQYDDGISATGTVAVAPTAEAKEELSNFIIRVAAKAAPKGYILGDPSPYDLEGEYAVGNPTNVWVEDLNGDGIKDMIMFFIPLPPSPSSGGRFYYRDTSKDILLIVTPTSLDGTSKVLAQISEKDFQKHYPDETDSWQQIWGTIDFDHDGKKELVAADILSGSGFDSVVLSINYRTGTISLLNLQSDLRGEPANISFAGQYLSSEGKPTGEGDFEYSFFRDVDHDGIDEYIQVGILIHTDNTEKVISLRAYKWNGTLFDYSSNLSTQLKATFNPLKDIPSKQYF